MFAGTVCIVDYFIIIDIFIHHKMIVEKKIQSKIKKKTTTKYN